MFRYHPEIEGLKVNEDGSEILLNGEPLEIKTSTNKFGPQLYITLYGKTVNVGRLVAECWLGMPEHYGQAAMRLDTKKGFHYTNMQWKEPRPKKQEPKLSKEQKQEIWGSLQAGRTLKEMAELYGVSDMTIHRIKKEFNSI